MLVLRDWQNFYILSGTAAATLVGLLFVALSVGTNLPTKQAQNYLHTFVTPTLVYYFQALVISCLAVMPLSNPLILAVALLLPACINIFMASKVFWQLRVVHISEEVRIEDSFWHFVIPFLAGVLFLITAIGFFIDQPLAPLGFAIADLLCLTIGLRNTWVLMIWLLLHREQPLTTKDTARQEEKAVL